MTTIQRAVVLSIRNTLGVFAEHAARYAGLSFLVAYVGRIQDRLDTIETLGQEQETCGTGVSAQKERVRDLALSAAFPVAGMVAAWARENGRMDVLERVQLAKSVWRRLPQAVFLDRLKAVLSLAKEHQADLLALGLTNETLQQLETRLEVFDAVVVAPRNATTRKKTLTELLKREVKALQQLLDEVIDPLMLQFQISAPEFYQAYTNARAVVRPAATPVERILERSIARKEVAQKRKQSRRNRSLAKASAATAELTARRQRREALRARSKQLSQANAASPLPGLDAVDGSRMVGLRPDTVLTGTASNPASTALDLAS